MKRCLPLLLFFFCTGGGCPGSSSIPGMPCDNPSTSGATSAMPGRGAFDDEPLPNARALAYAPLATNDIVETVGGGQGLQMVGFNFRLAGGSAACVAADLKLVRTLDGSMAGNRTTSVAVGVVDGARVTRSIWIPEYLRQMEGFTLTGVVGGAAVSMDLQVNAFASIPDLNSGSVDQ